jgi:hypothetical protein
LLNLFGLFLTMILYVIVMCLYIYMDSNPHLILFTKFCC